MISLLFNSQVELKMSEEEITAALNELRESVSEMNKFMKTLARDNQERCTFA